MKRNIPGMSKPGDYRIELGASSRDTRLAATARLEDRRLPP